MKSMQLTRFEKANHILMMNIYWVANAFRLEKRIQLYKKLIVDIQAELNKISLTKKKGVK